MNTQKINILETIGNTPLVKIDKLNPNSETNIFAKLEGFNPNGSIKDRVVLPMIENAEKQGILVRGKTLIESTSGNTGISLAMLGAIKGYKVIVVAPKSTSVIKQKITEFFGAKIILMEDEDWKKNAIKFVKQKAEKNKNFVLLNQYENKLNCATHYKTTAKEILKQMQDKNLDYFIAGIGTGGTITGIAKLLKEKFPKIQIIGIQPKLGTKIEGLQSLKSGYAPPILDIDLIDKIYDVDGKYALLWQKLLARKQGIFTGQSSGAAMFMAQKIAKKIKKGNIITIFPDRGERYIDII